ncbi:hypothetical protein [Streptomyces sp. S.PB5]|uniref:hypothetical protein n=1 Tax=Streptomyces sp. S.PB5 TaxID=3020844 RepID=UPI0025AFE94A|nr:hypothetical protein [Streptomyces sp. S.PB5]MDN3024451.1 hypothetical protein [Streptomyces sp. S.PB5]
MGERQNDGGVPGRRRVHPGGTGSPNAPETAAGLESLLAAAMREDRTGGAGEQRAVDAFLAARDAGAHRARTRRRDDWRPKEQRRSRSLRVTLSVAVASVTLGGVAVAGIGTVGSSSDSDQGKHPAGPRTSAPVRSSAAPSTGTPSEKPDRPVTAQDTEAHCRAYEQVQGRGNALDSTAWQRLVEAAGGEGDVAAYCAQQLGQGQGKATATAKPDTPEAPGAQENKGADKSEDKSAEQADKAPGKKKQ